MKNFITHNTDLKLRPASPTRGPNSKYVALLHGGRRLRRWSWLMVLLAVGANGLLFLALGLINRTPRQRPELTTYATMEIFEAEIPPPEIPVVEDAAPEFVETHLEQMDLEPMEILPKEPQRFNPRAADWIPQMPISSLPLSADAIKVSPLPKIQSQPSSSPMGPMLLSQVDKGPRRIDGREPVYPSWARRTGAEGTVTLRFLVNVEGKVGTVEVQQVAGDERFAQAARRCVVPWRFAPALYNNRPVAVWCVQTINFKLED